MIPLRGNFQMSTAPVKSKTNDNDISAFTKVFGLLVKNAFAFTVLMMGFVHAVLMVIFGVAGVLPLMFFNILSVVVYTFCFFLCRVGYIMPVYVSIIIEVTAYSVISTYFVGLECGTYFFLFSIIPIIIYFGSSLIKGRKRWSVGLMLFLDFMTFIILFVRYFYEQPVYQVSAVARLILVVFSAFAMVFAVIFYNAMYILTSENKMSDLEQVNKQLIVDAHEDALTSLLNRRGFLPIVRDLMNDKAKIPFCIAFCDLDDFKRVNDSYGHEAGDEVLQHAATIIKQELPGSSICRWGGEEFVILLKGCDKMSAKVKAERLRKTIESNPTVFFTKQIYVTTTIGLAEYKDKYKEPEEVIKKADERMYYGKQHGKNILVFEDSEE